MVPLVMSTPREDNPNGAFEEFATHLSLYDDSFHFVKKSYTLSSRQLSLTEDTQGSLPPSVFCPSSKKTDDVTGEVKVKRKCGRPRNPIPRHKRESHINAEHRRRGKIQDGFRTLKNIVPKYEQTSGRDSKADILFKAVEYSKQLQNDIKELSLSIETFKVERDLLNSDIKNYKTLVPDLRKYEELSTSLDDRYTDYVRQKTKESWAFGTFKVIMRPLFESYKLSVQGETMVDFLHSVADWAFHALSLANLRTVCQTTLRDYPSGGIGVTTPYKDSQTSNDPDLKSAGSRTRMLTSDRNNNQTPCLSDQVLSSEHYNYRDSSNLDGARRTQFYGNTFDSTYFTTNNSFGLPRGGHGGSFQPQQDLVPFNGGGVCGGNTIFSDLYYDLDHNHHHLSLARASIGGADYWSNHYLQQQTWHYYQGHHIPSPGHLQDVKKANPYWDHEHQQLSQNISGELCPDHYYYHGPLTLSDKRESRYDLRTSREMPESLPAAGSYLCQAAAEYLDLEHGQHNRPSHSSSESEGSGLNMETFARQATETLREQDKYAQLSPSTDDCISPGSSLFVPSPGLLSGRHHDYTLSHHTTSLLDHLRQPQQHPESHHTTSLLDHLKQPQQQHPERVDHLDAQQILPLPSYKNTFGDRAVEQHRHQAPKPNGEVGIKWTDDHFTNSPPSSALPVQKLESSTLLAEMLGQKSPPTWYTSYGARTSLPDQNQITSSVLPPGKSSADKNITNNLTNGFSIAIKQERINRLPSIVDSPCTENMEPNARDSSLSPKRKTQEEPMKFHPHPTESALTDLGMYYNPKLRRTLKNESTQPGRLDQENLFNDDVQNQMCYFELAHQQLLKEHGFHNRKVSHLGAPNKLPVHTSETDVLGKTDTVSKVQTPPSPPQTDYASYLGQASHLRLAMHDQQSSRDTSLKQNSGRKSSFEDAYPDVQLQTGTECKKMRHLPNNTRDNLLVKRQSNNLDTIYESSSVDKLDVVKFKGTSSEF